MGSLLKAASVSALVGTLAGLPLPLTHVAAVSRLVLPLGIDFISCALLNHLPLCSQKRLGQHSAQDRNIRGFQIHYRRRGESSGVHVPRPPRTIDHWSLLCHSSFVAAIG